MKKTIRQEDLDLKLGALAQNLETYDEQLAKLAAEYDAVDAELEARDPDSWRKEPKGTTDHSDALRAVDLAAEDASSDGAKSPVEDAKDSAASKRKRLRPTRSQVASGSSRAAGRPLTIEEQFRAEVDRITIQSREEEADLARRIEFARLRFETALERAGIDPESMAGHRPGLTGDEDGAIPVPVLKRWNELHLLRTELVERNLYLVLINVERYAHTRVSRMDLIQEGSAVLFRATDGFDWKRGLLFRTYAVHWLNQAFRSYLYNFGNTVRVPVYLQKAMKHVRDAMERMGDRGQDVQALAEATDLGENVVNSALRASRSTHSIDSVFPSSSGEGLSLRDTLTNDDPGGLYSPEMEDVGLEDGAEMALARLSERERYVIGLRFGLEGNREHTLAEIAEKMGVSLERIRQIQVRAISKMDTPRLRKAIAPFLAEGA